MFYVIVGFLLGALSGWITARLLKSRQRALLDGILGTAGFLLGLLVIFMPWHRNTIAYEFSNGIKVTSTSNQYQHPERVAVVAAVVLPMLQEVWRRAKSS
jgi:uncharacterized membrane protein YeaQ/YmgE (transglycosylase-associated protein family)